MMSNADREVRRQYLLTAIRHIDAARGALLVQREADPHSVDQHAINDVSRSAVGLVREYLGIGGNLHDIYPERAPSHPASSVKQRRK
jgi:hypothetical protein